jgi:hypothetical protein
VGWILTHWQLIYSIALTGNVSPRHEHACPFTTLDLQLFASALCGALILLHGFPARLRRSKKIF